MGKPYGYGTGIAGVIPPDRRPRLFAANPVRLAANEDRLLTAPNRDIVGFIVSVSEGEFKVWVGDQRGNSNSIAQFHFKTLGEPIFLPLVPDEYVFTFAAGNAEAKGCVTFIGY